MRRLITGTLTALVAMVLVAGPSFAAAPLLPTAVPPATGNNAVITVKVAGARTSLNGVGSLQGVTLGFYDNSTGGSPAFTCTSDADGDCSITVPNTQRFGANRDRQFWVRQISAPTAWYTNPTLGAGVPPVTADPYRFQTGSQLRSGTTYSSTIDFMIGTGNSASTSGGIWQNSLANPTLSQQCGIDVALLLDLSNSVTDSQLVQLKQAARTFTNSLVGTPSRIAIYTFATNAPASSGQTLNLTPVSTQAAADTVNTHINNLAKPGGDNGGTNWDRGIYQMAQAAAVFDEAIVLTDGNPTFYGNGAGPGDRTRFREVENGIFSANALKAQGTRVVGVGVGDGVSSAGSGNNLRAISGTTLNSDYFQTTDYSQAGQQLRQLALGACQGSVTVVKQVVPSSAPTGSIAGAQPAGGWDFAGQGSATVTVQAPTTRTTEGGTGAANFPLTFAGGNPSGNVTLTETPKPGYTLQQVSGNNAVCVRLDTGASVASTNVTNGFTVAANRDYPISCTVYNREPAAASSVVLNKRWRINGTMYAEGSQPTDFEAQGLIDGTPQGWGMARTGFAQGDTVALDERNVSVPTQCRLTSRRLTSANGTTVDLALPANQTLAAGTNTYAITNVVTCDTKLTLTKVVTDGSAEPTEWTLSAAAPTGALPGPAGVTGSPGATGVDVTPDATYPLAESGGDPNYLQVTDENAVLVPGATGSWYCVEVGTDGTTVIPGFSDGLNGGVTVPLGTWARCTAINRTATLELVKEVVNDHGGDAVPGAWDLTATPVDPPARVEAQTVNGADSEIFNVRPGVTYTLSESAGPSGYTNTSVICDILPDVTLLEEITLEVGEHARCVFTNSDSPAQLTLIKEVVNDNGGDAQPGDWTLSADGRTPITGPGNSPAVTEQRVLPGSYDLAESGGPAGYAPDDWNCGAATVTGSAVRVPLGEHVICTIVNDDRPAHLTLVKEVVNDNFGDAVPGDWTLAADGPTPISGAGNSPAVTDQAVDAGSYDLSESNGPAGYTAGPWNCGPAAVTGATLTVPLGADITCTITNNDQPSQLTLVKEVVNDNGGDAEPSDWRLSADGPTPISGPGNSAAVTERAVAPGAYDLAEAGGPAGYAAGDWNCGPAALTGSTVTVPLGGDVTCTIVNNDRPGQLTLVKEVVNDHGGDAEPGDWTLAADGPTPITGAGNSPAVTEQTVDAGDYDLSETDGPAGYAAGDWNCGPAALTGSTVTVPLGGDVTCTIINNDRPSQLTLVKEVVNDNGGDAVPGDWTLTADGPTPVTGPGNSPAVTGQTVLPGEYDLSEANGPGGYAAGDWDCSPAEVDGATITVPLGADITCTITNNDRPAQLTLIKEVVNDHGGDAVPSDWILTADGPTPISGAGNSPAVTEQTVDAGDYDLSETDGPGGYAAGDWNCGPAALAGSTVTVPNGSEITCTIINNDRPSHLTLVKDVVNNNGGTAEPGDWTLTADGPTPISGAGNSPAVTDREVLPGTYDLSEADGPSGYTAGPWDCGTAAVTGDTVRVPLGGDVTCTIVNNDQPAQLTLVKEVVNDHGGTAVGSDWTLSADGPTPISGDGNSPEVTEQTVDAGSYDLSEADGPGGYAAGDWNCGPAELDGATVTVPLGADITCTIINNDRPSHLTLVKEVTNNNGGTAVPSDWTLAADGPTPISGDGNSPAVTDQEVLPGDYDLSESDGPDGYAAGAWDCGPADVDDATVTVPLGANVTCTIVNSDQAAQLTLVKDVVNDNGGTAVPSDWTLTANGPTPISGPGNSPAVTEQTVDAGDYDLSEAGGPDGYAAGDWNCGPAVVDDATVTIPLGANVTCTIINNDRAAQLTLVKEVVNDNGGTAEPGDWTLAADGPTPISGPGNSDDVTDQTVLPGDYDLSEADGPGGYAAGDWTCGPAELDSATVTVPLGGNVTCTIVNNDRPAQLTLVKEVVNNNGGTAEPGDWTLTADGPTPISGPGNSPAVTEQTVDAGDYDLSEAGGPGGYAAGDWNCGTAAINGATVRVPVGGNVTCTIINNDRPALLTLVKDVVNDNGGDAVPGDWTLAADGPTPISGAGNSPAVTEQTVDAGDYDLSESGGPGGYAAGDWDCSPAEVDGATVTVQLGADITCTITNNDRPAQLTLVKDVVNDNGGTAVPSDWTLTADGPTPISGAGNSPAVTDQTVDAGDYDLSESGGPGGYAAGDWNCGPAALDGSTVTVRPGGNVTCTIVNNDRPAQLTLVKEVVNDHGGTAEPSDWTLSADGPTPITGDGNSPAVTDQTVDAGNYDLSESNGPSGYAAGDWDCGPAEMDGATVTVPNGSEITCTIINNDRPSHLTLVKDVVNNNGGTAEPGDWTLSADGPTPISGDGNSPAVTDQEVLPGDYDLSEADGPGGYAAGDWDCSPADVDGTTVTIPLGGNVTCTITNNDRPAQLTLVKEVVNDNGGDAEPSDWRLSADGPTPVSGPGNSPAVTEQTVDAGDYDLAESDGPDGYAAGDWDCDATLNGATVTVPNGGEVTCTIVNDDQPAQLTLIKEVVNDHGGTAVGSDWTLSADGPTPISGDGNSPAVTEQTVDAGSYDLSESGGPDGYAAGDWNCGPAALDGSTVRVPLGSDTTCTIINDDRPSHLTLVKEVTNNNGGTAEPGDWTLSADGLTPISGPGNSPAVTDQQVLPGDYELAEADGPGGYTPRDWNCGPAALTDATVTVPLGGNVTCTIVNDDEPAQLTLVKQVVNDNGGTAVPGDWTLKADGPTPISGDGNSPDVTDRTVDAGAYDLSEADGPSGYAAGDWNCGDAVLNGATVTVPNGGEVTCTIVNDDRPGQLTLVKEVVNDHGGTAVPSDWTLSADGPTPVSGPGNSPAVTDQAVDTGDYTLAEYGGPSGYTAGDWDCGNAVLDEAKVTVTVPLGGNVTCTIVNDDTSGTWTVEKSSDPASGSTVRPGDVITYTVTASKLSGVDLPNRMVTDDLSKVLNHATLVPGSITPSVGAASVDGDELTWTIPLLTDDPETVTYQVRVNDDAWGVTIRNHVTGDGAEPCVPGDEGGAGLTAAADEECDTTYHPTPKWVLEKSSDPVSGSTVDPGSVIAYTLTVENVSEAVVEGATVRDDLSDVLNHATLLGVPDGAKRKGTTLVWSVPTLQPGETATLTYKVRVDKDAENVTLKNVATPGDGGSCDNACSTNHKVPDEPDTEKPPSSFLPSTGGPSFWLALLGVGLVGAGGTALLVSRRRRTDN